MQHESRPNYRLRCLLALKRHESPDPSFFDSLPRQIRARIERERRPRLGASLASWWRHLRLEWDLKPAFAGAALIAAGGVYFFGIEIDTQFPGAHLPLSLGSQLSGAAALPQPFSAHVTFAGGQDQPSSLSAQGYAQPPRGMFRPGFVGYSTQPPLRLVNPAAADSNTVSYTPASLEFSR